MSKKTKGERGRSTLFQCDAPQAQSVFLAGSFNGWSIEAAPMIKDAEGHWSVTLDLPQGRHEFKFFVDGAWCCEPGCDDKNYQCPDCVINGFGTMNRVIEVAKE